MKQLVLIIPASLKQDTADFLRSMDRVTGFTFSDVEGHGPQSGQNPFLSDRDKVVGYTSRIRIDILLEDEHVESVFTSLRQSEIGLQKHAVYWLSAVEQSGRL